MCPVSYVWCVQQTPIWLTVGLSGARTLPHTHGDAPVSLHACRLLHMPRIPGALPDTRVRVAAPARCPLQAASSAQWALATTWGISTPPWLMARDEAREMAREGA